MDDENVKSLPQKDRLIVIKLCALLRLADSMDISHTGHVTDVTSDGNEIGLADENIRQERFDA